MPIQQLKEQPLLAEIHTVAVWQTFSNSDDSTVVLNVKDDATVGQKTVSLLSSMSGVRLN